MACAVSNRGSAERDHLSNPVAPHRASPQPLDQQFHRSKHWNLSTKRAKSLATKSLATKSLATQKRSTKESLATKSSSCELHVHP